MSQTYDDYMVLFNMIVPKKVILDDEDFITLFINKLEMIGVTAPEVEVVNYTVETIEFKVIIVKNYKIKLPLLQYIIDMLYPKKYNAINTHRTLGITIDENDNNITFISNSIIRRCSNYLTKLKIALDTFKMMVKKNMIDMK